MMEKARESEPIAKYCAPKIPLSLGVTGSAFTADSSSRKAPALLFCIA